MNTVPTDPGPDLFSALGELHLAPGGRSIAASTPPSQGRLFGPDDPKQTTLDAIMRPAEARPRTSEAPPA